MSGERFFIGWAGDAISRRSALLAGLAAGCTGAATGLGLAVSRPAVRGGVWAQDDVRDWPGVVVREPYPTLLTKGSDGTLRSMLLATEGKCGVGQLLTQADFAGGVVVRGSPIHRDGAYMLAVVEAPDWIRREPDAAVGITVPEAQTLGPFQGRGEILDVKCWYGAMRPSTGKTHKACASLCIRGGIPPAFFTTWKGARLAWLLTDQFGHPPGEDLLPYVADPVALTGTLSVRGNLRFLAMDPDSLRRV